MDSILDNTFNGFLNVKFAAAQSVGFYVAGSYQNSPIKISFFNGGNLVFTDTPVVGGVQSAFSFYGVDNLGSIDEFRLDSSSINNGFAPLGPVSLGGAVPEPATWAMMIIGFGAVGSAMRSRRRALA